MYKKKLFTQSAVFVLLVAFVPLLLSMIIPMEFAFIPVIGTAYSIIIQIYVFPLVILSTISHIQIFKFETDYGVLSWSGIGVLLALAFWIILLSVISYLVVKDKNFLAGLDEIERKSILDHRNRFNRYFKIIAIVLILCFLIGMSIITWYWY